MKHFAGLDVSVKETSICIVNDTGRIVREVVSEPDALWAQILDRGGEEATAPQRARHCTRQQARAASRGRYSTRGAFACIKTDAMASCPA
jgi:hypothetical protein